MVSNSDDTQVFTRVFVVDVGHVLGDAYLFFVSLQVVYMDGHTIGAVLKQYHVAFILISVDKMHEWLHVGRNRDGEG